MFIIACIVVLIESPAPTPVTMAPVSGSPPSPSTPQSAELDKLRCDEEKTIQQGEVQFTYGLIQPYPTSQSFLVVDLQITQQGTYINAISFASDPSSLQI